MKIPDDKKDLILELVGKLKNCPLCDAREWEMFERFCQFTELSRHAVIGSDTVYPVVLVSCKSCGYVVTLSAIRMGVLSPDS